MTPGRAIAIALVSTVAVLEAGVVGMFAVFSLSGDSWGIARAMALMLGCVLALTMVPALWLLRSGRSMPAALAAAGSALLFWCAWRFA